MKFILLCSLLCFSVLVAAFFIPKNTAHNTVQASPPTDPLLHQSPLNQPSFALRATAGEPIELGKVRWLRDLDAGRAESQKSGKPILILFQEVPGCSNCTRFGSSTLSHPLIVEAIESHFVPVCIFNNKGGKDAEALKLFGEPAWNNPVVRIVRTDNQDVVLRMPNFNSSLQLVNGMRRALDLTGVSAPRYLELLEEELSARESGLQTATFSMHCFWTGEGTFGAITGVIESEPGFQDGKEVVKVQFDPTVTSRDALEQQTRPKSFTACSKNEGFRSDREPKYYLAQTDYRFIPMSSLQACRANSLVGKRQSPDELLSPRQLELLKKVAENPDKNWENKIGAGISEMWSM
ncbi:MAG: VPGUxxT family thioredoxin-like (seleno)protein, type 2 [Saprospiraceae bacterium]|nr:VPGUxxT family thioredoxin-like (seleno)protein, type 2 [Saprospiraceae bacterium]